MCIRAKMFGNRPSSLCLWRNQTEQCQVQKAPQRKWKDDGCQAWSPSHDLIHRIKQDRKVTPPLSCLLLTAGWGGIAPSQYQAGSSSNVRIGSDRWHSKKRHKSHVSSKSIPKKQCRLSIRRKPEVLKAWQMAPLERVLPVWFLYTTWLWRGVGDCPLQWTSCWSNRGEEVLLVAKRSEHRGVITVSGGSSCDAQSSSLV